MIAGILGGVGLFLLGMVLLTDGLKAIAGDSLRSILARFTGGRVSSVVAGVTITLLMQSSSATVLTTIGFVSAGLLTFSQSIGVIFGANLGTTSIGWLVALLGLRFSISVVALPLVGIGAVMRLLTRGRMASVGLALAGFGLIFVGIDYLQGGMDSFALRFDATTLPGATVWGRIGLVGIGIVMTVILQSSSATVAATLTALHSGTILTEQAAALVVGQSIGTTVMAIIAVIGGSVASRRTAVSHVMFSLVAGAIGFVLIDPAIYLGTEILSFEPSVVIAAFLTGYKLIAIVLLLPFLTPFSNLIVRMVPDRGPELTRYLDDSLLEVPSLAVDTARRTTMGIAAHLVRRFMDAACGNTSRSGGNATTDVADAALLDVRSFLGRIPTSGGSKAEHTMHLSVLHAMDHLERLVERLRSQPRAHPEDDQMKRLRDRTCELMVELVRWMEGDSSDVPEEAVETISKDSANLRTEDRQMTLDAASTGLISPDRALERLDAMRWFDSSVYHIWRVTHHLAGADAHAEVEEEGEG